MAEGQQDSDDDMKAKVNFTPREYQIEILDRAKRENTIACLGTGTGKTFIAVLLIKEMAHKIQMPFNEGGQRVFFLVPTVPLVVQQAKVIKDHTELKVKGYFGEMNTDIWNREQWLKEFKDQQVLVMTGEICRIILAHKFLKVSDVCLLILDECHQARGKHPYTQVMNVISSQPKEIQPRVLGLSASLINNKCKLNRLNKELLELKDTLLSNITTATDYRDVLKYGTDAKEIVIHYNEFEIPYEFHDIVKLMKCTHSEVKEMKNAEKRKKVEKKQNLQTEILHNITFQSFGYQLELLEETTIKPEQCIAQVITILENVGIWCAYHAAKMLCSGLQNSAMRANEDNQLIVVKVMSTLYEFIQICETYEMHSFLNTLYTIPHKLKKIMDTLKALKQWSLKVRDSENIKKNSQSDVTFQVNPVDYMENRKLKTSNLFSLCGIVFVKERIMAYVLSKWLNELSKVNSEYNFVKSEYLFGHGVLQKEITSKEFSMSSKKQKEIVERFRKRKFNFLIATSVLEEGLDVQKCNFVIRFDFPDNFKSYIQSKGRARAKGSLYLLFVNNAAKDIFYPDLVNFKSTEMMLLKNCFNDDVENSIVKNKDLILPYIKSNENGDSIITESSAVGLLHRYCAMLPSDVSVNLKPHFIFNVINPDAVEKEYICTVLLPINCVVHKPIVGPKMKSKDLAKKAAALEACKSLDEAGELDEHLLPRSADLIVELAAEAEGVISEESTFPNINEAGSGKQRQFYRKAVAEILKNNIPADGIPCYLHVFVMDLIVPLPLCLNPRKRPIINPSDSIETFGLLTKSILPKICKFPIFTKCGKILVDIHLVQKPLILNENSLLKITEFHNFVFKDTLWIVESFMDFLPQSAEFSTYIVPVSKDKSEEYYINMELIVKSLSHSFNQEKQMTFEEIPRRKFEKSVFENAVVTKSYDIKKWSLEKPIFYHITQICDDITPSSNLPNQNLTFKDIYSSTYKLSIKYDNQPLLDVHRVQTLNMSTPCYISLEQIFNSQTEMSKTKQSHKKYREYLIPELCIIHPFPDPFFRKATYLPTILFRLNDLLIAEQIRQAVVCESYFRNSSFSDSFQWPTFHLETSDFQLTEYLIANNYISPEKSCNIEKSMDIIKDSNGNILSFEVDVDIKNNIGPNPAFLLHALTTKQSCDEFNLERLETIGDSFLKYAISVKLFSMYPLFDEGKLTALRSRLIKNLNLYHVMERKNLSNCVRNLAFCPSDSKSGTEVFKANKPFSNWLPPCYILKNVTYKDIENVNNYSSELCFDKTLVHLQKDCLKSIGAENIPQINIFNKDSIFDVMNNEDISHINNSITKNSFEHPVINKNSIKKVDMSNSCDVNCEKNLTSQNFICEKMQNLSIENDASTKSNINNDSIIVSCNVNITKHQVNIPQEQVKICKNIPKEIFYEYQLTSDKTVADSAEALIGVYLLSFGYKGALHFMHWLGISPFSTSKENGKEETDFKHWPPISANPLRRDVSLVQPMDNLLNFDEFERRIGYKFKQSAYLLQAFTHASYDITFNDLTDCYQRLEFLGDAVLDYLVTRTLYDWPKKHTPGELTDLRTALVNNTYFASLAVKYGFHKNLRCLSATLYRLVNRYAELLENSDSFQFFKEYGYYLEENECTDIEEIEVPKALGDIVESVAGAIYLDSGSSLDAVWCVFYPMIKPAMDHLCQFVPKSPVRELHELTKSQKIFKDVKVYNGKTYVHLELPDGTEFVGMGPNKKVAKKSASKKAMLFLREKDRASTSKES